MKKLCRMLVLLLAASFFVIANPVKAHASDAVLVSNISISVGSEGSETDQVSSTIQLLALVSIISLAPYLLVMLTSFTRIIIVLHFVRSALGTQQMPPNQVLIGLALFLSLFIMSPTLSKINENAWQPFTREEISQEQAIELAIEPVKNFMMGQAKTKDIELFVNLSGRTDVTVENMPMSILIPAFMLGEITWGFTFGFLIYMPFIVVDMVVASTLMAMGMMMLPPAMISLPFKLLLFIVLDGWNLIVEVLVKTFGM